MGVRRSGNSVFRAGTEALSQTQSQTSRNSDLTPSLRVWGRLLCLCLGAGFVIETSKREELAGGGEQPEKTVEDRDRSSWNSGDPEQDTYAPQAVFLLLHNALTVQLDSIIHN